MWGIEDIPLWCYLLALLVVLLYRVGTCNHDVFEKMGIPYDKPLPYIGNMMVLFFKTLPEYDSQFVKKFPGKLAGSFQGLKPVIECANIEFIKEVMIKQLPMFMDRRNFFDFEDAKIMKYQIFIMKGDHWKHVRSLLTPTFTSGKLKLMYPVINDCADKFVKHLRKTDSAPVVIKTYSEGFTMDVIASTAFGMDIDAQSRLDHPFIKHARTFLGLPKDSSWLCRFKSTFIIFGALSLPRRLMLWLSKFGLTVIDPESLAYFENVIDQILESMSENSDEGKTFITMCTDKMVDDTQLDRHSDLGNGRSVEWSSKGLSRNEVSANAISFFAAGYETTATALQFFFYSMAVYPEIQEKLHNSIVDVSKTGSISYDQLQKMAYLDWCISECLRVYTPVLRFDRVAKEDVEICGKHLPKGQIVACLPYAVHHDPEYWDDPETFNPERFSPENKSDIHQYTQLTFGLGGRSCIAKRLALLEIKVAVVKLLTEFRFEKTSDTPEPENLKFKKWAGFLQPANALKVSAVPRSI